MITLTPQQTLFLFFAYLIAAIPFGVIISLLVARKDVREQGSGNTGATNVSRLMGKKWGAMVLVLDALKGFVVVKLSAHFGGTAFENLTAVLAVVAHCYPIYLGFKGGKGVATALGVLAAMDTYLLWGALGVFIIVVVVTRRMSVGSLAAALSVALIAGLYHTQLTPLPALLIAGIVWWKHRANVVRVWKNEEPPFF